MTSTLGRCFSILNWKMAFLLKRTNINMENSLYQSNRQYHIEPGTREKALLMEDPILKRFKSQKRNVKVLKRMGEVLTGVVIAGCCYQIYVKSVIREEARKQAQTSQEAL